MRAQKQFARIGLVAAIGVMILCMAVVVAGTFYRGDLRAALPGSVAPDFSLFDAENHPISLSQLRGNVVVVYFSPQSNTGQPPVPPPDALAAGSDVPPATNPSTDATANANGHATNISTAGSADLEQLSALCRELGGDSHVKVLALRDQATTNASPTTSDVFAAGPTTAPSDSLVHTLLDKNGQVARDYKIDQIGAAPTFFVIDRDGIIRYRGSFEHGTDLLDKILPAAPAHGSLMNPATEPSSCPEVVQTLLSTEAATIASPSGHF